jgi:hypothetical protein
MNVIIRLMMTRRGEEGQEDVVFDEGEDEERGEDVTSDEDEEDE